MSREPLRAGDVVWAWRVQLPGDPAEPPVGWTAAPPDTGLAGLREALDAYRVRKSQNTCANLADHVEAFLAVLAAQVPEPSLDARLRTCEDELLPMWRAEVKRLRTYKHPVKDRGDGHCGFCTEPVEPVADYRGGRFRHTALRGGAATLRRATTVPTQAERNVMRQMRREASFKEVGAEILTRLRATTEAPE